ncbi:hypothetical protein ACFC1R_08525 [Kitasatospora sp. NPDC056138]|uniref:hypothetical protein n=1 Tax=Kitasatospora sp. NPDC056138 TaxID=3345724 RepID=UPI0035D73E42
MGRLARSGASICGDSVMASEPIGCDPLAEYREVAERRRQRRPDPLSAILAYVLSSGCVASLAAILLVCSRRH